MLDVIYPFHNRLHYTMITFPVVLWECIKSNAWLFIYDDDSQDGSSEFVEETLERSAYTNFHYEKQKIGNSTYCINRTVEQGQSKWLYKVDNDIIIPEGAFQYMIETMPEDGGFYMMQESGQFPKLGTGVVNRRRHIGGVGLFRREAFKNNVKSHNRFFGFTKFQLASPWGCYDTDAHNTNLELSPYYCRAQEYETKGWGRIVHRTKSVYDR